MTQRRHLVLMPGLDGTGKLFAPIIPYLQPHFDLSIVTYPDLDAFSDYVDVALQQLPPEPGFSLLAESFSGPVALAVMAQRRDDIGPSVLSATFARSPLSELNRMAKYVPDKIFSIGALNEFCLDVCAVNNEDFSETQPLPLNVTEQLDGTLLRHRISVMSRIDVSALLPEITTSILCLRAVRDRIVSEQHTQMLQQNLPNVIRGDLDGPHLLLQTLPERCAELTYKHVYSGAHRKQAG